MKKEKMKKKIDVVEEVVMKSKLADEPVTVEVPAPVEEPSVPVVVEEPVEETPEPAKTWAGKIIDKIQAWPKSRKYIAGMVAVFVLIVLISELANLIIKWTN